ncbi:high choriolytic enzyme 2 isoform X3 [Lates calcarifer]|uniref:Metalloendopeptidase n=1 Tax=Lates calcarifer TaxID=8187 RepID=A0AAJ7Q6C8_LATCA|nr:high choriolytic enzyme 2 isoform X3 [Lates calcarifer]
MALLKCTLGLLILLVVSDCSWAKKKELSVSELLWRANKDVVRTKDDPLVIDDIAYGDVTERNADPCVRQGCKWEKSRDGKVYVPYVISRQYSPHERSVIDRGLKSFNSNTCIRFVHRTKERDYLDIQSDEGCYSYVGRQGNAQTLSLERPGCVHHSVIQHELLHALGFHHEQSRSDRDQHIRVLWQNIDPENVDQFEIENTLNLNTPYDYISVMQYDRDAFSVNGLPTMVPIPDPSVQFGEATQMSRNDVIRVNRLYNC